MEITLTLNQGALDAEFKGADREELEDNLLQFMEFLEENEETLGGVEFTYDEEDTRDEPGLDPEYWEEKEEQENKDEGERENKQNGGPLSTVARTTGVTVEDLSDVIYVDLEGEQLPQLMFEDKTRLGDTKVDRQRNVSLLLLLAWHKAYGEERVKTSELKTSLSMSQVSESNLYNMWQSGKGEGWFDPSGRGNSATIALRGPGEREAYKLLRKLFKKDGE